MIIKLYSTFKPPNLVAMGGVDQVYSCDDYTQCLVNVITAVNVAAIGVTNLKGNMAFMSALRTRKSLG